MCALTVLLRLHMSRCEDATDMPDQFDQLGVLRVCCWHGGCVCGWVHANLDYADAGVAALLAG
jgi:hypothetical protein